MARLSKQESRQRWSEIREILWEWDPIGVSGLSDWSRDEYDCLAGPLLRMLERDASAEEVAHCLRQEIEEHFGLDPQHYDFPVFASRLRYWFQDRWPNSTV